MDKVDYCFYLIYSFYPDYPQKVINWDIVDTYSEVVDFQIREGFNKRSTNVSSFSSRLSALTALNQLLGFYND